MVAHRRQDESRIAANYTCLSKNHGRVQCSTRGYLAPMAHAAILQQVKRLQGRPWNPKALDTILREAGHDGERVELQRALDAARAEMTRHQRRFSALIEDPSPEEVLAFRVVGREISGRIQALEAQLAAMPAPTVNVARLQAVHKRLAGVDIPALVDRMSEQGDEVGLRELVVGLVESAKIVDRVPPARSKWLRAELVWTPEIQLMLDARPPLLDLGPDVERPHYSESEKERDHESYLRRRERQRAARENASSGETLP